MSTANGLCRIVDTDNIYIYYMKSEAVFTTPNPAWHTNNYQDKHPQ